MLCQALSQVMMFNSYVLYPSNPSLCTISWQSSTHGRTLAKGLGTVSLCRGCAKYLLKCPLRVWHLFLITPTSTPQNWVGLIKPLTLLPSKSLKRAGTGPTSEKSAVYISYKKIRHAELAVTKVLVNIARCSHGGRA